jgi:hypothetical protein
MTMMDNTGVNRNKSDKNYNPNVLVTKTTIETVVDSMDDLTHILERSRVTLHLYQHHQQQQRLQRLANTITPLLEIVSGIYHDHVLPPPPLAAVSNDIPQTLLNSGLVREVLMLVVATRTTTPLLSKFHPTYHTLSPVFFKSKEKIAAGLEYPGDTALSTDSSLTK